MYLWRRLLLAGGIEANPGPMTKLQEEKLEFVSAGIQRIEARNSNLLEAVSKVLNLHIEVQNGTAGTD